LERCFQALIVLYRRADLNLQATKNLHNNSANFTDKIPKF